MINGWKYYNHAMIPKCAPHESPNLQPIKDNRIWTCAKGALFARWTSHYDCQTETSWWYVVKDTPFDMQQLKAKRRYEINKGLKNFEVKRIDPGQYKEDLYHVQVAAYTAYPEKYRPKVDKAQFTQTICQIEHSIFFGAFSKEDGALCGYALLEKQGERAMKFAVQKTIPEQERFGVNAALVHGMLEDCRALLEAGGYVCDGERSISHETKFQDYLEKYFGFRKAYCVLHVKYRPGIHWIVMMLYPFKKLLARLDHIGIVHKINSVLTMEEIRRACAGDL